MLTLGWEPNFLAQLPMQTPPDSLIYRAFPTLRYPTCPTHSIWPPNFLVHLPLWAPNAGAVNCPIYPTSPTCRHSATQLSSSPTHVDTTARWPNTQLCTFPAHIPTTHTCRKLSNLPYFSYTWVPNCPTAWPNFLLYLPMQGAPTTETNCPIYPTFPTLAHPASPNHSICIWQPNLAAHLPNCQQGTQTAGSEPVGGLPLQWHPVIVYIWPQLWPKVWVSTRANLIFLILKAKRYDWFMNSNQGPLLLCISCQGFNGFEPVMGHVSYCTKIISGK